MVVLTDAPRATAPAAIRRAMLIVNPHARRAEHRVDDARRAFAAAGVAVDVRETVRPGHAGELAGEVRDARTDRRPDAIFTLGGDGTAMEVVGALAGQGVPVGILPGGTGNLIARTLGTPLGVGAAVRALLAGRVAHVDLGVVTAAGGMPRHFAFAAGVGIDARMIEETPARLKRRLGVLAYVLTAGRAVLARDRFRVRVVVDGVEIRREAVAVMVVNFGAVLGDLFRFGPGIEHDDGRLDLCLFAPTTVADAVRVLWRLTRKDFRDDRSMLFRAGREFLVEPETARAAQADGELLGATPITVRVEPLAASLLVPNTVRHGR